MTNSIVTKMLKINASSLSTTYKKAALRACYDQVSTLKRFYAAYLATIRKRRQRLEHLK